MGNFSLGFFTCLIAIGILSNIFREDFIMVDKLLKTECERTLPRDNHCVFIAVPEGEK